jgi:hypothetical protein
MKKRELEAYCGDLGQIFGIQECILEGGKSKGIKAYLIDNGNGLALIVLADKCLAIPILKFKGINIGFLSKTGICAPEFFQEEGTRGFLRNFEAGFLTTCGLTYMGSPCEVNHQKNGLHGVISNTPLERASTLVVWNKDKALMQISGYAREGYLFGPNLVIHKELDLPVGKNRLEIHDVVENRGFEASPLMLLYHFNYGYPMLDESCKVYCNYDSIRARDQGSDGRLKYINQFDKPIPGFEEIVAFRTMSAPNKRDGKIIIYNKNLGIAVQMFLNPKQLPVINQWKSPRAGDYVLGMEPGTGHVGGIIKTEKDGLLMKIMPGEKKHFDIIVEFMDEENKIKEAIEKLTI